MIEAEATDQWIDELKAAFPELALTVSGGQTRLLCQQREYHRRLSGTPQHLALVADRLTMSGLTWTRIQ